MKKRIIVLFLITMFIFTNKALCVEIIKEAGSIKLDGSSPCGKSACATTLNSYGIGVTLINSNGQIVGNRINIWNNETTKRYANIKKYGQIGKDINININELGKYKEAPCTENYLYNNISGTNYFNSDLLTKLSDNYNYSEYITNLNETNVKTILKYFGKNIEDSYNYFLKIEPIYFLHEKYFTYCNYFVGDNNNMLKYANDLKGKDKTFLYYYLIGGNNKTIDGDWNVFRNRLVNPSYSCPGLGGLKNVECTKLTLASYTASKKNVEALFDNRAGLGVGYVAIKDFFKSKFNIVKKDNTGALVTNATFDLYLYNYEDRLYKEFKKNLKTTSGRFSGNIDVTVGKYMLVERSAKGYDLTKSKCEGCTSYDSPNFYFEIDSTTTTKTLTITNVKTCVSEFDDIRNDNKGIVSMEKRIKLYDKYKESGKNFNKLLDMSNKTGSSACGNVDDKKIKDTYKYNLSCFNLKLNNQIPFDYNNLTYYSEIANIEGKVAYCLTTLDITTSGGIYDSVTSGRQVTYGSAPLATVRKVCYTYNISNMNTTTTQPADDISSYFPLISMKKYIKTFTNSNLIENYEYINKVNDKVKFVLESRNGNRYEYVMKNQYDYKDIILNYGTGQVIDIDKECNGYCLNIGKGIMSRLTEKGLQTIKYQVNYNYYINGKLQNNINNIDCKYTANPKIINPKLNLQFEQIMNKKPFMNKEGTSFRNVSYNWWSKTIDYKNLNDLNGDGIIDDLDKIIKKYSNNREESKSGDPKDNYLVDYVMNGRNNSYNSTKEGYRYKIVLTPSDIKKIRKYNDQVNNYNDNDIYCNNNTCSTEFIDNLRESKVCFKNICDSLSFKLDYAKQVYNIINES